MPTKKTADKPVFDTERGLVYYVLSSAFTAVMDVMDEGIELNNKQRASLAGTVFNEMRNVAQVIAHDAKAGTPVTWDDGDKEADQLRKLWKESGDEVIEKMAKVIGFTLGNEATFEEIFKGNEDTIAEVEAGAEVKEYFELDKSDKDTKEEGKEDAKTSE